MSDTATLPPQAALKSARELAEALPIRWPGESADYRHARTALLAEEIELRRQIQRVAEHRRTLPAGPVAKDYRFLDEQGNELGLVDLFGRHDTLFTYFWMFGPQRARPCPMCTSFVGSLDVPAPDIEQRLAIAIIGPGIAVALVGHPWIGGLLVGAGILLRRTIKYKAPRILLFLAAREASVYEQATENAVMEVRRA